MKSYNSLLNSLLFLLVLSLFASWSRDCRDIKVTAEVTHTTNDLNNGSVKLIFDGSNEAKEFDSFILIKGKKLSVNNNKASSLAAGKYDLVIRGKENSSNFCPKYIQILIN